MNLLNSVIEGISVARKVESLLIHRKSNNSDFISPFLFYRKSLKKHDEIPLSEITEDCITETFNSLQKTPLYIVLAGETEIVHPKTNEIQHFFIVKLFIKGLENAYVYSIPFKMNEDTFSPSNIKYAGCEKNIVYAYSQPQGEGSSCNTIKMDPKPPYENRAAFLIGHMDEERLWHDTKILIADMYCKLAVEENRLFELIFEISKFGKMTQEMDADFKNFQSYFDKTFAPSFENIKSELQLGNTTL